MRYFVVLLLLISSLSFGQSVYLHQNTQLFTSAGISLFSGDVCNDCTNLGYSVTVNPRFHIQKKLYFSPSFSYSRLSADDKNSSSRKIKALSFFSNNYQIDVNILYFLSSYGKFDNKSSLHPYLSAGAGALFFNPKTKFDNQVYELQGFKTEGEAYKRNTFILNGKIGFIYAINKNISVDINYTYFYTFSDYIDDVSKEYISQNQLVGKGADLADRTEEFGFVPAETQDGKHWKKESQRGSNSHTDFYSYIQIGVGFTLPK